MFGCGLVNVGLFELSVTVGNAGASVALLSGETTTSDRSPRSITAARFFEQPVSTAPTLLPKRLFLFWPELCETNHVRP